MKFQSAVDGWFYWLTLGLPGVIFVAVLMNMGAVSSSEMIIIGCAFIFAFGLPIWLLLSTYYVIEGRNLKIRSGPFNWSITINEIKSINPSRSVLSSPALSLNRLEIRYGRGQSILVSPRDVEGFQVALGKIGTEVHN